MLRGHTDVKLNGGYGFFCRRNCNSTELSVSITLILQKCDDNDKLVIRYNTKFAAAPNGDPTVTEAVAGATGIAINIGSS